MELAWQIIKNTATQSFGILWMLALVVLILLIVIELLREYSLMERITGWLRGAARFMDIPNEGMLGVVVGMLGGLAYGSSIMYDITKDLNLNVVQLNTIFILVSICHSVIEETAVYAATGANALLIVGSRALFGILSMVIYRGMTWKKKIYTQC